MRQALEPKFVGETADRVFDFTSSLAAAETISTQSVAASVYSGVDPSPGDLIDGAASASGAQVTQSLTGGVAGVVYALVCTVTTSLSQTLQLSAYFPVLENLP